MNNPENYYTSSRTASAVNAAAETIPPHSLVYVTVTAEPPQATKPTLNGQHVGVSGPVAVKAGKKFTAIYGHAVIIALKGSGSAGEDFGAAPGEWRAVKGNRGFRLIGNGVLYDNTVSPATYIAWARPHLDAGEVLGWVQRTGDFDATTSTWKGILLRNTGSGYATGGALDVRIGTIESGSRVILNKPYQGTLNGTVTIEGSPYPVFWIAGNVGCILPICTDGKTTYDRFDFYYPFQRVTNVNSSTGEPL